MCIYIYICIAISSASIFQAGANFWQWEHQVAKKLTSVKSWNWTTWQDRNTHNNSNNNKLIITMMLVTYNNDAKIIIIIIIIIITIVIIVVIVIVIVLILPSPSP